MSTKEVVPVLLPIVTVLALAFVPMLIAPVVPVSKPSTPVVVVSSAIPPVPEVRFTAVAPVLFPILTVLALAFVPMFTAPVVPESNVKVPVVPVVSEKLLVAPVERLDAPSPDNESVPEVAVKLSAPLVSVKPFEAVNKPADVIVPVPVVTRLPVVETVMSAAKSFPTTDEKVGNPEALP